MTDLLDTNGMSREALEGFLKDLREARKKGYEAPKKKGKSTNPFAGIDPKIAEQVLGPLVTQAAKAAARSGVGQYLGREAEEVKGMLEEKAQEKLGVPTEEGVKKLFGQ